MQPIIFESCERRNVFKRFFVTTIAESKEKMQWKFIIN